ncbi:response regulator transcription factor [Seleniivibrio woodruffii]|uniref:Response regulator receiver domain-containing protein n=1 Tax=Seleniivibrio woodruffii TaxID=1078050 RepID=A0A4R1KDC9_9BACT|nr:response regulator [Seleniivibrio woodruffii]TCK62003.1 response regulator receiver domain-containing protein [Seleniivibrio woodruffii]TVZ34880.1 two-component system alkaline phosphatase synthesis response regulator PhoP [Seleniivibrio woodruffii]
MKVLIADDELRLRKVVSLHLKKSGFDVFEAGNGQQAVDMAKEIIPDVIVLDVMMPEKTGLEACAELKAHPELSKIPVVLLTAMAEADDMKKGRDAGADEYLTKPFSPKELIDIIRSRS